MKSFGNPLLIFFTFSLFGFQTPPICQITQFNPSVISISFGTYSLATEHCNIFLNSPSAGEVQIACYLPNNPTPVKNEIDIPANPGFNGGWSFPDGSMSWILSPGAFHLVGAGSDGVEVHLDGTF